jgi:dihydrofolate reductase
MVQAVDQTAFSEKETIRMRLTAHTFVSIDGVMQGPGGPDEDRSGGFSAGGWLVPLSDEDMGRIVVDWFGATGALLLGHTTYDLFRGFWPDVDQDGDAVSRAINTRPKYVAATTPVEVGPWAETTTVIDGDLVATIRRLKDERGDELQIHGSYGLLQALQATGLIDEYRLIIFPVVVGSGKRLFEPGMTPTGFVVVSRDTTSTGATVLNLVPTPLAVGAFTVDDGRDVAVVG